MDMLVRMISHDNIILNSLLKDSPADLYKAGLRLRTETQSGRSVDIGLNEGEALGSVRVKSTRPDPGQGDLITVSCAYGSNTPFTKCVVSSSKEWQELPLFKTLDGSGTVHMPFIMYFNFRLTSDRDVMYEYDVHVAPAYAQPTIPGRINNVSVLKNNNENKYMLCMQGITTALKLYFEGPDVSISKIYLRLNEWEACTYLLHKTPEGAWVFEWPFKLPVEAHCPNMSRIDNMYLYVEGTGYDQIYIQQQAVNFLTWQYPQFMFTI